MNAIRGMRRTHQTHPEERDAVNEGQIIAVDVEGEYVMYLQLDEESED